jgi:glucose/arabinose dehydrogenase
LTSVVACSSKDHSAARHDAGTDAPMGSGGKMSGGGGSSPAANGGTPVATGGTTPASGGTTAATDAPPPPQMKDFCSLPGSILFDESGRHVVGTDTGSLPWLTVQKGFCAHHYATLASVREIRFGPGGEFFGASPGQSMVGGANAGLGAVVMLPDDNNDGQAEAPIKILPGLTQAHGFAFAPGYIYYQATTTEIRRVKYESGSRTPIANANTAGELVANIQVYTSTSHWTKTIDVSDDGTVYVTNGGDQGSNCAQPTPFQGGILKIDGSSGGHQVARGFRNPIHVRCQHGTNHCFATELGRDSSATLGGREKLILVTEGDDWGHPCCASKNVPFSDITPAPDCSKVASEDNAFVIGSTPFGFDFAPQSWPAPLAGSVFIALHGVFGSWTGARVVAIATDPVTGMPLKSSTTGMTASGPITDFASGWDDMSNAHGRPAIATFAPDGRLFVGDDTTGEVFWVAPIVTH